MLKTLAVLTICCVTALPLAAQADASSDALAAAMANVREGEWNDAITEARGAGPIGSDIVEWHRLRAGQGTFNDTVAFLYRHADWPGLKLLRKRSERNVPLGRRPDDVLAFFADQPPQSGVGSVALISALASKGRNDEANKEAKRAWTTFVLSSTDEAWLLKRYESELEQLHVERLDMLLWRNAETAARRMFDRVSSGQRRLAEARLALRGNKKGVDGLVGKVPSALSDDPGLAFERMQWRARKGRNKDAIELLLSQSQEELGNASAWAGWRRSFARSEMRAGRTETAYKLASAHGLTEGSHFADLEWLAGYLALRYQKDGEKALQHFLRFRGAVETPISLGRAGYWEGRAHELLGDQDTARLAYLFGAEYQTSFYGLLAAEKAGKPLDPEFVQTPPTPDLASTSFDKSTVLKDAKLLLAAGERDLGERFLTHLTESLEKSEIEQLAAYVIEQGDPHIAVMIGKRAASQAIVVPFAYFALNDFGLTEIPVPEELALAIARRESEFDHLVTSGAGAQGLMQVMPKTARGVAEYLEIPYNRTRLLEDPIYNARIGTAYLDELMEIFDGNMVMVSAGYNAGPGRPLSWMERLGDPRTGRVDVVDWIEHIPFDETRNYVMRVMESIPIYRARLSGDLGPVEFTALLLDQSGHPRRATKGTFVRPRARPEPLTD